MDTIDVPAIGTPLPDDKYDDVKFADALLTSLLSLDQATLQAECKQNSPDQNHIVWELKKPSNETSFLVATSTDPGKFRNILARFGHHYMDGQLYNGYAQKLLR